jgi:phosphomannomutase
MYKTYDIRGLFPEQLNEENAYVIGRAFVVLLQRDKENNNNNNTNGKKLTLVVSRDMRLSSPAIAAHVISGMLDQGADVVDIGMNATPTFYFGVATYGYNGGVQVTASHNPREYNGLKLVRERAISVGGDEIQEIKKLVQENTFDIVEKGKVYNKHDVLHKHMQQVLRYKTFPIKKLKVVADPANTMGIPLLRALFEALPCTLVEMNFTLDGTMPSHHPDPLQDETLAELKNKVVEVGADLGVATDGDGDRVFFIDDKGETIPQSIVRGLMAQAFLKTHPGAKICYDIRPGKITRDMIVSAGGIPVVTRVGHTLIKKKMREEDAVFAGESSGHFFLRTEHGSYEVPMVVLLKMLELISSHGKNISEIIKPYKKYVHSGEINCRVEDKDGKIKEIADRYADGKLSHLDGITVEYDDFWFNVRKSNTEPLLRLNLESVSREIMEKKRDEVLKVIRERLTQKSHG